MAHSSDIFAMFRYEPRTDSEGYGGEICHQPPINVSFTLMFMSFFCLSFAPFQTTMEWRGQVWYMGGRSPGCFFGFFPRAAFQSQTNREKLYIESR